jgi:flagellar hook-associated protein 1 FlgK
MAQAGLLTTGHNIANASTPGYNRQVVVQGANIANLTGAGYIGAGAHVQAVQRVYDQFLGRQILNAEAGVAEMDSYLAQIQQMDNLLADPDAGLSPALANFFKGVQDVAANPASIPGRQSMLSAAQSMVARFQGLDQRMSEIRDGLNSQVRSQVESINTFATQLADINQRIIIAESGSSTQVPNDLLDQREQMVRELNQVVRVTTVTQSDGSFNVFIGNGQPLVIGSQSYSLLAVAANDDPERFTVAMEGVGGTVLTLPESQIAGGSLGGLLSFRSSSLDAAQNALGRIAITMAQNFNDQHRLGMDLTGALGTDFFSFPPPTLRPSALNTGTGAPSVSFDPATLSQLSGSDYQLFSPDGSSFQLRRLSDGKVTAVNSVPQIVDGLSIDTTGWVPARGDSILLQPTRAGARGLAIALADPRSIAAAAPIRTSAALSNEGTGKIDSGQVNDTENVAFNSFRTTGDLAPPLLIRFDSPANVGDPMTYSIYDASLFDENDLNAGLLEPNIIYTAGANVFPTPALLDYGIQVKLSGAPAAGDRFTIEGNKNGVSDNRNAMLLGALQTKSTMIDAGGKATASYQSAYSQIVSAVGSKTAEVKTIGAAQKGLADHATTAMQELSGVNLDEEAANLLRFQQAYQAAAKILEIAGRVFDEVIALGR